MGKPFVNGPSPCRTAGGRFSFRKSKRDLDDAALQPGRTTKPALLEDFQHRNVVRKNLRDQFLERGVAGDRDEMAQQRSADALPMVLVDHGKSDFGRTGLHDDVASAADDHRSFPFSHGRDQGDMIDEVDVHEEFDFLFRKFSLRAEETEIQGLRAGASDGAQKSARSFVLSARISIGRPSRNKSTAEYLAALIIFGIPPISAIWSRSPKENPIIRIYFHWPKSL